MKKGAIHEVKSDGTEAHDEHSEKEAITGGRALIMADLHQVFQDFQATSHGDQKLNIQEFNG